MSRLRWLGAGIVRLSEVIVLAAALCLAAIAIIGPLTGQQVMDVTSGSMGPAIPAGALILVSPAHEADLRVGDVITVQLPSGTVLTHRIVATSVVDGHRMLTIRGDANDPTAVEAVAANRAIGRVTAIVPGAGQYLEPLTRPTAIIAWVGMVTLGFLRRLTRGARVRRGRVRLGPAFRMTPAGIVVALLMMVIVPIGAATIRDSAAIFTTSASVSGNTFSSGTWGGSDYRSATTGAWDTASTWERYNGSSWVAALQAPAITDTVITIRSGHVVTVGSDRSVDQVVVDSGGQLTVQSGAILTVAAGAGTDLDVSGLVSVDGTLTVDTGADVGIESGGIVDNGATINGAGTITGLSGTLEAVGGSRSIANAVTLTIGLTVSGAEDLTLTGVLGDAGTLTKTGTGTLILARANTYSGTTTISAGTVRIQDASALGTTAGPTSVASGGAIELDDLGLNVAEPVNSLIGTGVGGTGAIRNLANANSWSGAITLGVGGATVASDAGTLTLGAISGATRPLTVDGSGNTNIGGIIATTSGTVNKAGTGTLTLSAANTYTGVTTLSTGIIRIQDSAALGTTAGGTTVASGAALELDDVGLAVAEPITSLIGTGIGSTGAIRNLANSNSMSGTITLGAGGATVVSEAGTLTLGAIGGATRPLTVDGAGDVTISGVISTTSGTLTKEGIGTLTLSAANTYTGLSTINSGRVKAQNNTSFGTTAGGTTLASGAAIEIDGSGRTIAEPVTSLIGTGIGDAGAIRNLANNNSWTGAITLGSGGATIVSDSGKLTLGAVGGAGETLTVTGSGDTTASGVISTTTGNVTKNGSGTLILSGVNTFTGSTVINDGIVSIATDRGLGAVPIVATPGQVTINAAQLTTTATFTMNANRGITLAGESTVAVTGTLTYSGVIAGTGALVKTGTGTLLLGAAVNSYTGSTTVTAGILSIAADTALGLAPVTPTAGQLTFDGGSLTTTVGFTLDQDRGVQLNTTGTITTTGSLVYGGVVAGNGALTKAGAGTLTLSGVNTYTGITTITTGILSIAADTALGAAPSLATAGQLAIGPGTLATTAGFTLAATRGIALTGTGTFNISGTVLYAGVVDGAGGLTKTGTGTLTLSSANTYAGTTTVTTGVIRIQNDAALGTTAGATTVASGAAIELDATGLNVSETITSLVGTGISATGAIRNLANNNMWSGAITLGGTTTIGSDAGMLTTAGITATTRALTVAGSGDTTIGGAIATTSTLTKIGTGTLTLSAANTYTGVTTVTAGVIRIQDSAALGTTAGATTVASGAAIEIDASGLSVAETISSLIGTGIGGAGAIRNLANDNTWSGTITLGTGGATIASDSGTMTTAGITASARNLTVTGGGDTTIGGIIATTTGTLTKTGTGTLTLSAANTYTGTTTVSAGSLLLNGSTGAAAATVASGATLRGSGSMAGSVNVTGTVAPGSSAALLTTGAFTFSANSTCAIEIGGTTVATQYDQLRVASGAITMGATVTLSLVAIGGFTPTVGQTFQIVDKVAAGAITGTFNGLAQGASIANFLGSSLHATISYTGGDGNDIVLTVTP
ncbi:MAG: signal peptidase I [Chloroflexota bacterium]